MGSPQNTMDGIEKSLLAIAMESQEAPEELKVPSPGKGTCQEDSMEVGEGPTEYRHGLGENRGWEAAKSFPGPSLKESHFCSLGTETFRRGFRLGPLLLGHLPVLLFEAHI